MKQSLLEKLNLAYRFKFNDNGHTIMANASSLTGKIVIVDGASVSKKRKRSIGAISFTSTVLTMNFILM